jgi:hypothetical protein
LPRQKRDFDKLTCHVVRLGGLLVRDLQVAVALKVMTPGMFTPSERCPQPSLARLGLQPPPT